MNNHDLFFNLLQRLFLFVLFLAIEASGHSHQCTNTYTTTSIAANVGALGDSTRAFFCQLFSESAPLFPGGSLYKMDRGRAATGIQRGSQG